MSITLGEFKSRLEAFSRFPPDSWVHFERVRVDADGLSGGGLAVPTWSPKPNWLYRWVGRFFGWYGKARTAQNLVSFVNCSIEILDFMDEATDPFQKIALLSRVTAAAEAILTKLNQSHSFQEKLREALLRFDQQKQMRQGKGAPSRVDAVKAVSVSIEEQPSRPEEKQTEALKTQIRVEKPLESQELADSLGFLLTKAKLNFADFKGLLGHYYGMVHSLDHRREFYRTQKSSTIPPPEVISEFRTLSPLRQGYVLVALPNISMWGEEECRKALIAIKLIKSIPNRFLDTQLKKMRALCFTLWDLSQTKDGLEEFAQIFSRIQDRTAQQILLFAPRLDDQTALLLEEQDDREVAKGILQIYGIEAKDELIERLAGK